MKRRHSTATWRRPHARGGEPTRTQGYTRLIETGPSARTVTYGYDNAYRLTSETITTPAGALGATYDHTGDRLSRTSTIGVIPAASATYDATIARPASPTTATVTPPSPAA